MTRRLLALVIFTVLLILTGTVNLAQARDLPCNTGSLEHKARCLAKEPGLHPAGGIQHALSILRCEGGIDRRASYGGPWQLSAAEVRSFDNGISREWHQRINPLGLNNGYRQTVAVFWHKDWSWSSCS